jgi:hypothetical protein
MSSKHTRPWYVSERACEDYRETLTADGDRGGDLQMLKALKILRSILVNLGIIAIGLYAILEGADPTLIGTVALSVLGGYNGLEFSDYAALVQAYNELQQEDQK